MSWQAVAAARRHRVGHASWKAVLLVVADAAHPDGTGCTMKYATLAAEAECSIPTVKRAVPAMLEAGVLKGRPGDLAVEMDESIDMREGVTTTPERSHRDQTVSNDEVSPRSRPVSPRDPNGLTLIPPSEPTQNRPSTDLFDDFWSTYPKRTAKGAARRAWEKAVKRAEPAVIIAGAARYRDDPQRNPIYTAYPATWLNAERWEDEFEVLAAAPDRYIDPAGHRRC